MQIWHILKSFYDSSSWSFDCMSYLSRGSLGSLHCVPILFVSDHTDTVTVTSITFLNFCRLFLSMTLNMTFSIILFNIFSCIIYMTMSNWVWWFWSLPHHFHLLYWFPILLLQSLCKEIFLLNLKNSIKNVLIDIFWTHLQPDHVMQASAWRILVQ